MSDTGRWRPGIGDPTAIGWITVLAYVAAAILCAMCYAREPEYNRHKRFWLFVTVLMVLLGINKQLDLQTWFTQTGRDMAFSEGWYGNRRVVQASFISALAIFGFVTQVWLYRSLRDLGSEVRWAAVGLIFLMVFVVVRAASFHHVDILLFADIGGFRLNWILELTGISCIAAAAAMRLKRPKRRVGERIRIPKR